MIDTPMRKTLLRWKGFQSAVAMLAAAALFTACTEDESDPMSNFNRSAMLTDAADRIIIPAYTTLAQSVDALSAAADAFTTNPNATTLQAARDAWTLSYRDWQYANTFNFGPAGEQGLRKSLLEEIGTWPVSENKVENAITSGAFNFNDFNRDARGFIAVEYLLYGADGNDAALIESFAVSEIRRQYLTGCIANMAGRIAQVRSDWAGGYRNAFITNNGTAVGSSVALYYNQFVRSYESIKNFKVGLPMGLRPGQVQSEPQLVEAYYSGQSLSMIANHLDAIEKIWYGRDRSGTDGIGFEEYLASATGGPALIDATKAQLDMVKTALTAVPSTPPLSELIVSNPDPVDALHTELTRHTRFFKSDMSSLLGISITYSSGDGD